MKRALTALVPAIFVALFWFFVSTNRSNFPDPLAIHWGLSGEPDGFGSLDGQLLMVSLVLLLVGGLWAGIVYLRRIPSSVRALFLVITGIIWMLLFVVFSYTFLVQFGLSDARDAGIDIVFFVLLLTIPLLVLPWLMSKPKIELGGQLRVYYWKVPMLRLRYKEVSSVEVVDARARDFGGWGIRYANRTTAFLPNSGPGVLLNLAGGERVLIRTDDASGIAQEITRRSGS